MIYFGNNSLGRCLPVSMSVVIVTVLLFVSNNVVPHERPWLNEQDPQINEVDIASVNTLPDELFDGWQTSSLQVEGIDPAKIALLIKRIKLGHYVGINGLVLVRNGKLVYENYFGSFRSKSSGELRPYSRQELHQTRSSFKSVTGLLAGIAIDEKILSLDDLAMPLIADYHTAMDPDPRKQKITIRDLLQMASGFDCSEMPGASPQRESELRNNFDMVKSHAELQMVDEPGATWRYCSTNPILFGIALEAALARGGHGPLKFFLDTRLMAPLDIAHYQTGRSPKGHLLMHGGQKMRPRDLAKFGQLIASGGRWQENQIISENWIETLKSTGRQTDWSWTSSVSSDAGMQRQSHYQYQWFQTMFRVGEQDVKLIHSWGNGGQFIIAIPALDLVVTTTGANYGDEKLELQKQIFHMLHTYIFPALQS